MIAFILIAAGIVMLITAWYDPDLTGPFRVFVLVLLTTLVSSVLVAQVGRWFA